LNVKTFAVARRRGRACYAVAAAGVLFAGSLLVEGQAPLGFPPGPVVNPDRDTPAAIALGRALFFDARLSSDGTISCASCHRPDRAFTSDAAISPGVEGRLGTRNAPTILNAAYAPVLFWDGRATTLEEQIRYPIVHPKEMNMTMAAVVKLVTGDATYSDMFRQAFGEQPPTFALVSQALASFERTIISGDTPFDRFYFAADTAALSEAARRGWELFRGRLGCVRCHSVDATNPWFTDWSYHNIGVGLDAITPDLGRYAVTRQAVDKGRFRTPSLRHVSLTSPYMHDGSLKTLRAVLDFYERGGLENPFLDEQIKPLPMSDDDKEDVIRFLHSLAKPAPGEGRQ
jgi:cytochrome c peroxidase